MLRVSCEPASSKRASVSDEGLKVLGFNVEALIFRIGFWGFLIIFI